MRVRVKLGGDLKRYGGGLQELELNDQASVAEAMERVGIDEEAGEVLVIVNDEIVPRASTDGSS
jgi:sulfur carrier protein ThiS